MACVLWLASKLLRGVLSLKFLKYCGYWISTERVCVYGLVLKPADLLLFRPQNVMTSVMLEVLGPQVQRVGFVNSGQHWTMLWVQPLPSFQNLTWDQLKPMHPEISTCTHICTRIHTQIRFFFLSKPNSCFLHISISFSLWSSHLDASRMKAVSVFYLTTRRISFLFHKIWLFSLNTFQKCDV